MERVSITPLTRVRVEERNVEPAALLPFSLALDEADAPMDVVDALALAAFATGRQPWARTARVERPRADATLLPANARVLRSATEDGRSSVFAVGDGWTLRRDRRRRRR